MPNNGTNLAKDEERLLQHEAFIARVLKERNQRDAPKPVWQRFVESAGGAALITVVIGGLAGAWISDAIQSRSRKQELQMVAFREFLTKRDEFENRLQERVGSSISASENVFGNSKPDMVIRPELDKQTKDKLAERKETTIAAFNELETDWRNQQESLPHLLNYYFPNQQEVNAHWSAFASAFTTYLDCAGKWSNDHPSSNQTGSACKDEKNSLLKNSRALQAAFEASRKYAWEDLEEALKKP